MAFAYQGVEQRAVAGRCAQRGTRVAAVGDETQAWAAPLDQGIGALGGRVTDVIGFL